MKTIVAKDYRDLCLKAAEIIVAQVSRKKDSVLGLATGFTYLGVYEVLSKYAGLDFSKIKTLNLDEYVGLPYEHEQSYRHYMDNNLFRHINIQRENTFLPDGAAPCLEDECRRYDALINKLGIDLLLLGLGQNGHIGFNEPSDVFVPNTHVANLSESTINANSVLFGDAAKVPRKAVTMGINGIMQAERILLCVSGRKKADILEHALFGPITPSVPASVLRLNRGLTVLADEDAWGKEVKEVTE
ncbi:MAG: glucosamine-6-phosphate deaminase [Firmicutes bacterium]|nr:glucosamine-6-phosphate deaminase [Bacillota bacterium]